MKNAIESIARDYFESSNKAKLSVIRTMFSENATYSSVATGLYYGVDDIMTMITDFFSQYKALHWNINELNVITDYIVEIQFSFKATDQSDKHITRTGIEKLVIDGGKIRHIEISKP